MLQSIRAVPAVGFGATCWQGGVNYLYKWGLNRLTGTVTQVDEEDNGRDGEDFERVWLAIDQAICGRVPSSSKRGQERSDRNIYPELNRERP